MRVIFKGSGRTSSDPSWVGINVKCNYCNFSGILERGDDVEHIPAEGSLDLEFYSVNCPGCKGILVVPDASDSILEL